MKKKIEKIANEPLRDVNLNLLELIENFNFLSDHGRATTAAQGTHPTEKRGNFKS